ncbi:MAG: metallophosphoesterase [Myxococcales bacterium]|nr:metallophosphoesterase [Myxococcales bacterium]
MRKLVLTRGPQGAGKSSTLAACGLEPYTLSGDLLRGVYASPIMNRRGQLGLSQEHDRRVWPQLMALLDERMARGELIAVDATHPNASALAPYRKLARAHRYALVCLDFAGVPLELTLARNRARPEHKVVPEGSVRRTHEACLRGQVPDDITTIPWREDDGHAAALDAWLAEPVLELDDYARVHHVGDIQGCFGPLAGDGGLLAGGLRDDEFYLFIGDLCDRGPESAEVMRWFLDHALGRPNVRAHWGNHEDYLHRWARGLELKSAEFTERTLPQLEAAGITQADADAICDQLVDCTRYRYRGRQVLVTHAGLPTVPARPERISTRQYSHGTGYYADPIDAEFSERAPAGWVQVHGHRNPSCLPVQAGARSYNLEGQVEYGGALRALTLDARGFTPRELPSRRYRALTERLRIEDPLIDRALLPQWVTPEMTTKTLDAETLASLRAHSLIQEKASTTRPHISSFNFTRDAFYRREWDALNVTARGLFVHALDGAVAARSYDKFFNLGERPETEPAALERSLRFPVTTYVKDNGYLGILGYDPLREELLFCSKSSPDSDFAAWFREITLAALPPGGAERLRRFLRDTQSSMAFEVIDPVRDPHIIEYAAPQVTLLDVIRRAPTFERVGYKRLQKIAAHFELPVKQRATIFEDWRGLSRWLELACAPGYQWRGAHVEGFVLEDAAGFLTKIKLDYYNFWKRMRSLKDRLVKARASGKPLARDTSEPRVRGFVEWCARQPDELLTQDIIRVRAAYLRGEGADAPVVTVAEPPPQERKELVGFRSMLGSLEAKGAEYELKPATADRVVAQALADDDKLALLRASPLRARIVLAASEGEDRDDVAERLGVDIA